MTFAREFKAARRRLGVSQAAAAKRWKVPVKALQNWEQGVRTPRAPTLLRLLPVLFPKGVGKAASRPHQNGRSRLVRPSRGRLSESATQLHRVA